MINSNVSIYKTDFMRNQAATGGSFYSQNSLIDLELVI